MYMNKKIIAIMGPSGAGKTTLGKNLSSRLKLIIPKHCTTRERRKDDEDGFYRYLTHDIYKQNLDNNKFLISSGDGQIVKKECGNFYGVLKEDCLAAWEKSDSIVLFVSYKDIETLKKIEQNGLEVDIINLTFKNIEKGMKERLIGNKERNQSPIDINNRIQIALDDTNKYQKLLETYAKTIIYTDLLDIEQTYQKACTDLTLLKSI